jgi:hypothetical protein
MNKRVKKVLSKGALGAAVAAGPTAAFIGISEMQTSDLWMYSFMGTFLLLIFLHWFFRDENFDRIQTIERILSVLLPLLFILFLYAFMMESFVAMFVSFGIFVVTYLIYLLVGILKFQLGKNK